MNKIENYLGIANHDIQMTNNSQELKSYVASILCENDELQQQNQKYKEVINKAIEYINDNLTISSILDGEKYYTINNYSFDYKELLDILNEEESDSNVKD